MSFPAHLGHTPKVVVDRLLPVCGVSNSELVGYTCHPCAAGKAYDSLLDACRTCMLGSYQSELAQSECVAALPGWSTAHTHTWKSSTVMREHCPCSK
eukprot:912623-Amphidinium_carterae.1